MKLFLFHLLEILCSALSEVPFGEYDPTDCTTQKIEHGSNCTLTCAEGFELKGPMIKSCGGKRTGTWSQKNKHPRCVGKKHFIRLGIIVLKLNLIYVYLPVF